MPQPSAATSKLKLSLKLAVSRLRMVQQKETALAKQSRRQMAQLLESHKDESARIRVENIIRQDITVELLEILELYCELLLARIGMMDGKECDPGLEEAVKSIIYAAPRTEIRELQQVREILVGKFGKEFALAAIENSDGRVAERVMKKLRIDPPSQELVTLYLKEIARTYGVNWGVTPPSSPPPPDFDDDDEDARPSTHIPAQALPSHPDAAQELNLATPPGRKVNPRSPIHVAPQSPTTENLHPVVKFPDPPVLKPNAGGKTAGAVVGGAAAVKAKPQGKVPDADDLMARFAALKKR
ncbi:regulator of Vps4 activity in the MVB pathway-domain-containing protein [Peziza echinospora]|nr:regulator of Vps4 activity in the MVB pathway-domain-containing protein [Peziza echinospora]